MDKIAKNIRECRKELNMSQEELAVLLGVSKSTISNYETEATTPSPSMLVKLAQTLDVPISRFFLREEEEPLPPEIVTGGLDVVTGACPNEDGDINLYIANKDGGACIAYSQYEHNYFRVRTGSEPPYSYIFTERADCLPDGEETIFACVNGGNADVYEYAKDGTSYILRNEKQSYTIDNPEQIRILSIRRT